MLVELLPITDIQPYPGNPRVNDDGVDAVARSLKEFGFRQPIVVDTQKVIIVGHTRYKASLILGLDRVPVHVADNLTPEQVRAYRIADNQTADLSEWDFKLLPIELTALKAADYDLGNLGFDPDELQRLLNPTIKEGLVDPDEVPVPPEEPITQLGDLLILGHHRLLCGDSTNVAAIARLMNGQMADLLLTDPPYGIEYEGKTAEKLTIQGDAKSESGYDSLLRQSLGVAITHLKPGGSFYLWHADSMGLPTRAAVRDCGLEVRQCLVWVKSTFTLGRQDYQWQHEPCLYGWKDGAAHSWLNDRCQTTVLEFPKPARNGEHPTMKPVELFAYLLRNSSREGESVLDIFGGSGTTLIAAEQTNRRAYLMELDPRYCDVIVSRWEAFTGKKAERRPASL